MVFSGIYMVLFNQPASTYHSILGLFLIDSPDFPVITVIPGEKFA